MCRCARVSTLLEILQGRRLAGQEGLRDLRVSTLLEILPRRGPQDAPLKISNVSTLLEILQTI